MNNGLGGTFQDVCFIDRFPAHLLQFPLHFM